MDTTQTPPRIYLAEDEPMIADFLKTVLEDEGYEVRLFERPEQVLDETVDRPDLLITDYLMPGINGLQLTCRCRNRWPHVRVLMLSGNLLEDDLRFVPTSPDLFLSKPFSPQELLKVVNQLLCTREKV